MSKSIVDLVSSYAAETSSDLGLQLQLDGAGAGAGVGVGAVQQPPAHQSVQLQGSTPPLAAVNPLNATRQPLFTPAASRSPASEAVGGDGSGIGGHSTHLPTATGTIAQPSLPDSKTAKKAAQIQRLASTSTSFCSCLCSFALKEAL